MTPTIVSSLLSRFDRLVAVLSREKVKVRNENFCFHFFQVQNDAVSLGSVHLQRANNNNSPRTDRLSLRGKDAIKVQRPLQTQEILEPGVL